MGFRDDQLAGHERARSLEQEVARLEAENAALRAEAATQPRKSRPAAGRLAGPLALVALLAAVGAAVIPVPQLRLLLALTAVLALSGAMLSKIVGAFLHVVEPGDLLVLSGVRRVDADGRAHAYRIVREGRVMQTPLLETATWMRLGPWRLTVDLRGVYAREAPVDLRASAAVRVSTDPELVHHAVERFLGHEPSEIVTVARQTIQGALRAVAAELTAEELQRDTLRFVEHLERHLASDLERLGLSLDTFVMDEVAEAR